MASDWPRFGFSLLNSGYQTTADSLAVGSAATLDIYSTDYPKTLGGMVRGQIAVVGSNWYAPCDDGKLYKVAISGAATAWATNSGAGSARKMRATPHVTGGKAYCCSDDGKLFRIDDTAGTVDWTASLNCSYSSPLLSGSFVYVGGTDGKLYKRTAADGTAGAGSWSYDTGTSAAGGIVTAIALYNGLVFASAGSKVWAVDVTAGTLTRSFACRTGAVVATAPCIQVDASGTALLCFGSNDHFYYCYNADTGHKIWERRTSGDVTTAGIAFTANSETTPGVFLGQHNWRNSFNVAATGKQKWVRDGTASASLLTMPAVTNTGVNAVEFNVFPPNDGRIGMWTANDSPGGHVPIWKYGTSTGNNGAASSSNKFNYSSPSIAGGIVFIGADDSKVYVFKP